MRVAALVFLIALLAPATAAAESFGESVQGRALEVTRSGDPAAPARVLVGRLSRAAARRHADAVLGVLPAATPASSAPAPPIRWNPIPFGADRRRQMRQYSRRHYGEAQARLVQPRVIVEHYTASSSFSSAFNTFAANSRDIEFGELPGVCAHYLIDRDGTIHQLVSLRWRCRHTVGLNDSAIGIEHVGVSDADVMGRPRQLAASLRLTRWLQGRFGVLTRDVIGHSESLTSPYHHERVRAMRKRTHGDFSAATMRRYRARLP